MRQFVGTFIEMIIISRFIDSDTPQYNRRMIPVALDHRIHISNGALFPLFTSNVLPAGDLLKHQQPQLIATIQKCR